MASSDHATFHLILFLAHHQSSLGYRGVTILVHSWVHKDGPQLVWWGITNVFVQYEIIKVQIVNFEVGYN